VWGACASECGCVCACVCTQVCVCVCMKVNEKENVNVSWAGEYNVKLNVREMQAQTNVSCGVGKWIIICAYVYKWVSESICEEVFNAKYF